VRKILDTTTQDEFFTNSIGMKFKSIPAGSFMMGSLDWEKGRNIDEALHKVTLTKSFRGA
jgi:formylglycine-generating enzyme required for sulfatase activity